MEKAQIKTVEEEFRALSMIYKSGLDLDLVERAYARKLIYATINLNEVFECEALKGLGDLYLHKAMMNTDKVENFHKACSLYMELLQYYTSVEEKQIVEHRIKYAEKCTKLVHDQDIVKVRTTNSDNTILGVSMMLDKVEKKTRVKGRDMMPLIEGYTNSLVQAIVDSNKCLQVESLKSLGDLYLEKGRVGKDKVAFTRAAGLYRAALDRCEDSDGRETLEHRINYAERVKRKLTMELDRPPWMLDRSAPIVSSPALNESLHGQTEESNAVLLVTDLYASSTINREVVQILTRAGRKVYSMVLEATEEDRKCAEADGVELILPYHYQLFHTSEPCLDWLTFDHHIRYPSLPSDVGWIVGHTGVTSRAAATIKEQRFPQAKLSLVTQTIPKYRKKYKGDSIRQDAEKADIVFSVGHTVHDHFTNMFWAIPEDKRPAHYLFLPKPSELFQKTTVEYFDTSEKVVLLIGKVNTAERVKGFDLAAKTLSKVAERSQDRIKLRIRGVSREEYQASMDILQTSINSRKLIPTLLPHGTQEDVCRDMQQAHLVLMPSCAEPFGLVGLEAMAAGVPVLISDQSGLATLVHEVIPEFHHSILRITGDDSVDVWRWADQIADVLGMSKVEFRRAAELKQKLLESKYWEESHQQFLQACGGHVSPRFEGVPKLRQRSGEQQQEDGRLLEPSTLQLAVSQESNAVLVVTDLYASSTINREVVQILTRAWRKVYSMVLEDTEEDRKCAEADGVVLILPYRHQEDNREPSLDWLTFDHPTRYPRLPPDIGWIVGHTGVTSRAAATIKEQRFPQANISLVTQTIPEDTEKNKGEERAMYIGWMEDSIRQDAEKADTVFSVGHRTLDHFLTSFHAIPEDKRPTHYLFLPKPSDLSLKTRVYYKETKEKVVLLIGKVNTAERVKGFDLAAKTLSKVAERSQDRIKLRIRGVSKENYQASMDILQANINSGKLIPTLLPHGTQEDVCRDMQQAHLVLMPSCAEPFGLVGLEAMAAGVPVLVSDQSGLATLVHEVIPEFHHSILRITGDDSVDVWRWADQIADVLGMSEVEFRRAAELKQKLLESRYWEESHQQFLQACGGHVSPRFEGVPKLRQRSGEQQQEDGRLLEPSTLQLAVSQESNAVLLVTDLYASSTINREVVQILTRAGRKVYSMVLEDTEEDRKCAEADGVVLILPYRHQYDNREPCLDWLTFDHPTRYPRLPPDIGWIVGHTGVTSRAAATIKEQRFPQANISLVTQTIPEDTEKYKGEERAMYIGWMEDSIRQDAEKADTVFSVGHRTLDHFLNSFRAISKDKRPTHYLFLPKPSDLSLKTRVYYKETKDKVVLLIGKVNTAERVKDFDLAAKTLSKVAERSQDRIKLRIRGVSKENYQASMSILQANINSGKLIPSLLPHGTQEDVCRDMQQAHLVLMPSCAEPFGLVGLEAMAAGVPVLVSDQSGLATLVHEVIPEFHHSILRITGDDSVDVWRWADQIADVLRMSEVEFRRAAELKQKLLESRYWEESHQQFLQACGGHVSPRFEGWTDWNGTLAALTVEHLQCFKDSETIHLHPEATAIIGPNSSGKTTLIRAWLLFATLSHEMSSRSSGKQKKPKSEGEEPKLISNSTITDIFALSDIRDFWHRRNTEKPVKISGRDADENELQFIIHYVVGGTLVRVQQITNEKSHRLVGHSHRPVLAVLNNVNSDAYKPQVPVKVPVPSFPVVRLDHTRVFSMLCELQQDKAYWKCLEAMLESVQPGCAIRVISGVRRIGEKVIMVRERSVDIPLQTCDSGLLQVVAVLAFVLHSLKSFSRHKPLNFDLDRPIATVLLDDIGSFLGSDIFGKLSKCLTSKINCLTVISTLWDGVALECNRKISLQGPK